MQHVRGRAPFQRMMGTIWVLSRSSGARWLLGSTVGLENVSFRGNTWEKFASHR